MADSAPIPAPLDAPLRERLLSQPEMILEDRDLMKALIAANQRAMGMNVVDLRGIAMERLEARLDRLEDTHRSVIAAAYENLAGTNQVHRAVLAVLEPARFEEFLAALGGPVAEILRLDAVRLVLETRQRSEDPALSKAGEVLFVADPGFVDSYLSGPRGGATRPVVLRQTRSEGEGIYGDKTGWVRSEAVARLDLGPGRLPAALAMGSEDPHHFRANQGTDLLAFFAGVFERAMRRWLA
ncbi:DUF484 family protein [Frigidibacter oleivorans]|uniref:DUF484 family protein n=1 Tax=Frigidibacter oleivorans TaxID=2487129 RepID=UPI000F8E05AA|nr:DUF484 family protein [Frigidibacter oleivorans]